MRFLALFVLFLISTFHAQVNSLELMTLDNFIAKMKTENSAYQASDVNKTASVQETSTAKLLTSPQFYATADTSEDKSPTTAPQINGTLRTTSEVQTGVQMQTDFGLNGKVFVGESDTKVSGADPNFLPPNQAELVLQNYGVELQLPILKNGFGRDVQLKKEFIQNSSDASFAYAQFDQLQLENKASLTYLKVAKLQEMENLQKTSYAQGESLVRWVKERVDTKILEPSDLSQSIASMQVRDLNLQSTLLSLSEAQKDFNTIIGLDPSHILPKLQSLEELVPNKELISSAMYVRSDVKALSKSVAADRGNLLLKQEDFKPELNIVGKAVGYTKQSNLNDTARCTSFQDCSQSYIGLTFKIPLDIAAVDNSLASTESRIKAKELSLEDAKKQSAADVQKLFQTSRLLKMQRDLSRKIIETQKLRLSQEHKRQIYGRASAFDIIRAEQDYVDSQLNCLAIIYSQAEINTNFKLFEGQK